MLENIEDLRVVVKVFYSLSGISSSFLVTTSMNGLTFRSLHLHFLQNRHEKLLWVYGTISWNSRTHGMRNERYLGLE